MYNVHLYETSACLFGSLYNALEWYVIRTGYYTRRRQVKNTMPRYFGGVGVYV